MSAIRVLDNDTIDKIAAGEVVERPLSIVKELVENSIDSGASSITVEIRNGGTSFLRITDNGCGMTEEQMSKIFEPYYTTKSSGTGLGLTVLFKIMKQHDGDVTVKSTLGEGSEFTLHIPVPSSERFKLTDGGSER